MDILVLLTVVLSHTSILECHTNTSDEPCPFLDSVNISGIPVNAENGVDDTIFNMDNHSYLVGIFDYKIVNNTVRLPVEPHKRACKCRDRPCVRLVCPRGMVYVKSLDGTESCLGDQRLRDIDIDVRLANGTVQTQNLFERFAYTLGSACQQIVLADDAWEMDENGIVSTPVGDVYTHRDYLLWPVVNEITNLTELNMMYCFDQSKYRGYTIEIGFLLSMLILLTTLCVFIILPELRNLHGKSVMSYLAGLTFASSLVIYKPNYFNVAAVWCVPLGYVIYFCFISSSIWLTVISFDMWWHFRGIQSTRKLNENRRFIIYSAVAWGLALFMALLCFVMDNSWWVPEYMRPKIGVTSCYLQNDHWIEVFYIHLPIVLIWSVNVIFFALTALRIRRVQLEMLRVTSAGDNNRPSDNAKENYGLLLRMSVVMGVPWFYIIDLLSVPIDSWFWAAVLLDLSNIVQSVLIFVLFIVKPKVKILLQKRFELALAQCRRFGSR